MMFSAVWSAAQPRLGATAVRDGRDAGVYPPRDEERIFGQNLPQALMSEALPGSLQLVDGRTEAEGTRFGADDLAAWCRGFGSGGEAVVRRVGAAGDGPAHVGMAQASAW